MDHVKVVMSNLHKIGKW